jgi:hypothetical protein
VRTSRPRLSWALALALSSLLVGSLVANLPSSASASGTAGTRAHIRVESASGLGNARISWATGDQTIGDIYVSKNGGAEKLFARGRSGSQEVPWLVGGNAYVFRLYRQGRTKLLASVTVRPHGTPSPTSKGRPTARAPRLNARPNPVPVDKGTGTTQISWTTGGATVGEVYVSENGARERLLSRGRSGSVRVPWILAGRTYTFRLYTGSHKRQVAATVVRSASSVPQPAASVPHSSTSPGTSLWVWVVLGAAIGLVVLGGAYVSLRRW